MSASRTLAGASRATATCRGVRVTATGPRTPQFLPGNRNHLPHDPTLLSQKTAVTIVPR